MEFNISAQPLDTYFTLLQPGLLVPLFFRVWVFNSCALPIFSSNGVLPAQVTYFLTLPGMYLIIDMESVTDQGWIRGFCDVGEVGGHGMMQDGRHTKHEGKPADIHSSSVLAGNGRTKLPFLVRVFM
jgi:hypothetical protein